MTWDSMGGVKMVRINRVYTGTGDDGTSSFVDGSRHSKSHPRFEAVGTCDELNSIVGLIRRECVRLPVHSDGGRSISIERIQNLSEIALDRIQNELFDIGAELACEPDKIPEHIQLINMEQCNQLTDEMDAWLENLDPLTNFILPTGVGPEPLIHYARTVTRRLERKLIAVQDHTEGAPVREILRVYLNRLSDWFFVFSRWVTKNMGGKENLWTPLAKRKASSNVANLIRKINSNEDDYNHLN